MAENGEMFINIKRRKKEQQPEEESMGKELKRPVQIIPPAAVEGERKGSLPTLPPGMVEGIMKDGAEEKRFAVSPQTNALYRLICTVNATTTPIQDAVKALMVELGAEEATIHLAGRSGAAILEHYITVKRAGEQMVVLPMGEEPGYLSLASFTDRSMFFVVPRLKQKKHAKSTLYRFNMVPGDATYTLRDVKNGDRQSCSVPLFMSETLAGKEVSKKLGVLTLKGKTLAVQEGRQTGAPAVQNAALLVACGARLLSRIIDARFDPLTGLQKRPEYDAQLKKMVSEYVAGGQNFSVLMLDLDHFKNVNDTFGHNAGDIALRAVSEAMSQSLRGFRKGDVQERRLVGLPNDVDYCYRWGGEELAVILPATTMNEARLIAERLRGSIKAMRVDVGGTNIGVTISVGVSDADSVVGRGKHDTDMENLALKLTHEADFALYTAKRGGRNMVAYAERDGDNQLQYYIYAHPTITN